MENNETKGESRYGYTFLGEEIEELDKKRKHHSRRRLHRRRPIAKQPKIDDWKVNEMNLFIMNDGELYRQRYMPLVNNYVKKVKRGVFDKTLAIRGIANNLVPAGITKYRRELNSNMTLSRAEKVAVAREIYSGMKEDIKWVIQRKKPIL